MNDLVERLRWQSGKRQTTDGILLSQAADEVERLRGDNERFRELFALQWDATQSAETAAMKAEVERLREAIRIVRGVILRECLELRFTAEECAIIDRLLQT